MALEMYLGVTGLHGFLFVDFDSSQSVICLSENVYYLHLYL